MCCLNCLMEKKFSVISAGNTTSYFYPKFCYLWKKRSLRRNIGTSAGITTNNYAYWLLWFRLLTKTISFGTTRRRISMNLKNKAQNTSVVYWVRNNETTGDANAVFRRFCCGSRPTPSLMQNRLSLSLTFRTSTSNLSRSRSKRPSDSIFYIRESEW